MKRAATRKSTRAKREIAPAIEQALAVEEGPAQRRIDRRPIEARTDNQRLYLAAMAGAPLTFATGSAGTGKTYLAAATAAEQLEKKLVERVIITRPAVEVGEKMGFLPGEIKEKFDPYLRPFIEVMEERLGRSKVENLLKRGVIEARPLAYMRGSTFKESFVILDEAQNTTRGVMKMFLTRIGDNCTVVVNGDTTQRDIREPSGLDHAVALLKGLQKVRHVHFTTADVVRSGLVHDILVRYEAEAAQ